MRTLKLWIENTKIILSCHLVRIMQVCIANLFDILYKHNIYQIVLHIHRQQCD